MGSPSAPQDHKTKTDPRGLQRLTIGGKSRILRFDGNAIIEACEVTGLNDLPEILNAAAMMNPRLIRGLIWAGLLHEEDKLELTEVGSWLGEGRGKVSFSDALVPCIAAVNAAIGVDENDTREAVEGARGQADPTRRGGTGKKRSAPRSQQESTTTSSGD